MPAPHETAATFYHPLLHPSFSLLIRSSPASTKRLEARRRGKEGEKKGRKREEKGKKKGRKREEKEGGGAEEEEADE